MTRNTDGPSDVGEGVLTLRCYRPERLSTMAICQRIRMDCCVAFTPGIVRMAPVGLPPPGRLGGYDRCLSGWAWLRLRLRGLAWRGGQFASRGVETRPWISLQLRQALRDGFQVERLEV